VLLENNLDLHLLNIDFKEAYDFTNRTYLHEVLKDFGVPKKLANLRKMTLHCPNGKIKSQDQMIETFGIEISLRQCDAL
jgi:hypothetical protein